MEHQIMILIVALAVSFAILIGVAVWPVRVHLPRALPQIPESYPHKRHVGMPRHGR
jgi:uncharacterized iron-regulated membrane protein